MFVYPIIRANPFDFFWPSSHAILDASDGNLISLLRNISEYSNNKYNLIEDSESFAVAIVRAHGGYSDQLVSMLWTFKSIFPSGPHIRVIVIPTEKGSAATIRSVLSTGWPSPQPTYIKVTVVDIPDWFYDFYGSFILSLCSNSWKQAMIGSRTFKTNEVSRHCEVNSPLHYVLVDLILLYVQQQCKTCERVFVTNADDFYTEFFLKHALSHDCDEFDVVMCNMVSKGRYFQVRARKRKVDLGAIIVSVNFLEKTGVRFLNSLPSLPQANDYHDADGFFVESLRNHGAAIKIFQEIAFFHN